MKKKYRQKTRQETNADLYPRFSVGALNFARDEQGATMVEYGLILALISIICILAISKIGMITRGFFNMAASTL